MRGVPWFFVVALLAVDVLMLLERRQLQGRLEAVERTSAAARVESRYAEEEEAILATAGALPPGLPGVETGPGAGDKVQFLLLASIDDCANCIEDEVAKLNEVSRWRSGRIAAVRGYFVDEDRAERAERFIRGLSPAPSFPLSVGNALARVRRATTPLVLVVRSRDGRILDAHKPIPENLRRRDAFYARWSSLLGLS